MTIIHSCIRVPDLPQALKRYNTITNSKVEISRLLHKGKLLGEFFFATDLDGYKIEVLAKAGRFANL